MTRTLSRRGYYQRIVHAQRLYSKGEGWWEIEMGCGHLAAACVGTASPIGTWVHCFYRCVALPGT